MGSACSSCKNIQNQAHLEKIIRQDIDVERSPSFLDSPLGVLFDVKRSPSFHRQPLDVLFAFAALTGIPPYIFDLSRIEDFSIPPTTEQQAIRFQPREAGSFVSYPPLGGTVFYLKTAQVRGQINEEWPVCYHGVHSPFYRISSDNEQINPPLDIMKITKIFKQRILRPGYRNIYGHSRCLNPNHITECEIPMPACYCSNVFQYAKLQVGLDKFAVVLQLRVDPNHIHIPRTIDGIQNLWVLNSEHIIIEALILTGLFLAAYKPWSFSR